MLKWFSRHIVVNVDSSKIEIRSKKGHGTFSPHIELDPKGIVISVGKSEKSKSDNINLHIFSDTWEGTHALIMQSYFKYFISQYCSSFLRPAIMVVPSKSFYETYGKHCAEYLALSLSTSFGGETFLCNENQIPYVLFQQAVGRSSKACDAQTISEKLAKRARDRFSDLM